MFKLNEDLVKFRYIQLPLETIEIESVEDMFLRYEISDQEVLDSLKIHLNLTSLMIQLGLQLKISKRHHY